MNDCPHISYCSDEGVAELRLCRPEKRNAISFAMWQAIGDGLESLKTDDTIRVLIVSGEGEKAFSAGADISEFATLRATPEGREAYATAMRNAFEQLRNFPKLTIAKIDGVCIGGGAELAMECDVMIASSRSKLAITPARLGLGYAWQDVERLVSRVGKSAAKEILATARQFDAEHALALGWLNHVVPPEELTPYVEGYAAEVAANAPLSVKAAKLIVNEMSKPATDRNLVFFDELVEACYASDDYQEGQRAFEEKRPPMYKGS